jgi:hypothetical protein
MNWNIDTLWVKPSEAGFENVVITAAWRCQGEQEHNGKTVTADVYSTASFSPPDADSFVRFDDLTKEQVLSWIWARGVDKDVTEAAVAQQLADRINPPVIMPPLPWLTSAAPSPAE